MTPTAPTHAVKSLGKAFIDFTVTAFKAWRGKSVTHVVVTPTRIKVDGMKPPTPSMVQSTYKLRVTTLEKHNATVRASMADQFKATLGVEIRPDDDPFEITH